MVTGRLTALLHWVQRRMVWLLLATYAIGAVWPTTGRAMRSLTVASLPWLHGDHFSLSLPALMLGLLLVVGGLGTSLEAALAVLRRPTLLLAGLLANALFPIAFTIAASVGLHAWHSTHEAQSVLVGLAMVGAMPIAGSSTAWSQNANGNLALSLGLVIGSTLLSPLLTPLGLHAVGLVTQGDYSEDLHELARSGTNAFLVFAVVVPTLVGIALRLLLGPARIARALPTLKLLNLVNLLLLTYANAAVALPQVLAQPDWDLLVLIVALSISLCVGAFALGWLLPRALGAQRDEQTALMFGMGMNNNGTGLVLASQALADHPLVLLPIIFYNLVQQIVAGLVDRARGRAPESTDRTTRRVERVKR